MVPFLTLKVKAYIFLTSEVEHRIIDVTIINMPIQKIKECIVLLILLGFIAYLPSLFGNFIWDDEDFITENQYVKTFQIDKFFTRNAIEGRGKISNYYRPIQFTLYSIIYKVAGPNPFFFHFVGVILHISAAIALLLFLNRLINKTSVSFIITLFFLMHPIQTESVSYISGLSDALFSLFMFSSLYFFIQEKRTKKQTILSIIFFICSLFSKELGLMTIGILFWIIILFTTHRNRTNIYLFISFCLIGGAFLLARTTFLQFSDITEAWKGTLYGSSLSVRLGTFFHNFFIYISIIIFPKDLFMERDFSIPVMSSALTIWTLFFVITVGTIIAVIGMTKKEQEKLFFFFLTFLTCMLPFTGIMLLNGIFYEHFLYVPLLFFTGFIIYFFKLLIPKKTGILLLCVILLLFFIRSYIRQFEWIDNIRFYEQTLTHAPKSVRIINNLGMEYAQKGMLKESIRTYQRGISIDKRIPNLYHNIGNSYITLGNTKEAEQYFIKAIEVNPSFIFSYSALINLYMQTNQTEKIKEWAEKAYVQFPQNNEFTDLMHL